MDACTSCGHDLGTNPECEACLEAVVARGMKTVDAAAARSAPARARAWVEGPGAAAPGILKRRVAFLASLLDEHAAGSAPLSAKAVAACAFALLYVEGPHDLIADATRFAGHVDDLAVVALAVEEVRAELEKRAAARGQSLEQHGF